MILDQQTLVILSQLAIADNTVRIVEQLDRKAYTNVNAVLETLGGKWNRKAKAHLFPPEVEIEEAVAAVITTGEVDTIRDQRKRLGWFPTPEPVAAQLFELADISSPRHPGTLGREMQVLEPSAGEGHLVKHVGQHSRTARITAIELDPARAAALRLVCTTIEADFLDVKPSDLPPQDRVVMNPPFCKSGKGDHLDHVQHAMGFLRPGGRLVSVLPSSARFNQNKRHEAFRAWAGEHGAAWHDLPPFSFKASGTGVNATVLVLGK